MQTSCRQCSLVHSTTLGFCEPCTHDLPKIYMERSYRLRKLECLTVRMHSVELTPRREPTEPIASLPTRYPTATVSPRSIKLSFYPETSLSQADETVAPNLILAAGHSAAPTCGRKQGALETLITLDTPRDDIFATYPTMYTHASRSWV